MLLDILKYIDCVKLLTFYKSNKLIVPERQYLNLFRFDETIYENRI